MTIFDLTDYATSNVMMPSRHCCSRSSSAGSYCTVVETGQASRIEYGENDHCCARFALAGDWLRARGLQAENSVGYAHARLARSREIVAVAVEHLRREPLIFLHPREASCGECDEARASAPPNR